MKVLKHLLSGVVLSCVSLLSPASFAANTYTSLVIFGDSLSDSGNNALAFGTAAGQSITGNDYIPSLPYSLPPPVGFGTYSNGNVWATQFAAMAGLSAIPSVGGGSNYAFGGATTSGGQVPSLTSQAAMYFGSSPAPDSIANTLFVVAGGGNNARATFSSVAGLADFGMIGATMTSAASSYANDIGAIVDQLQASGAQNIIVWNTPNIGRAPAVVAAAPFTASGLTGAQLGSMVSGSNNGALTSRLAGEAGVQIFDLYSLVAQAGANGFTNTTDACGAASNSALCPNIASALFWDGIHPTTAGHSLIAQQMFALAAPVPEPSTYAMLFVGLLVITSVVRRRAN